MTTNPGWRSTCITARTDASGVPLALVVLDDREDFYSHIYRLADLESEDNETIYEAEAWLTSMWRAPGGAVYAVDSEGLVHSNATGVFAVVNTVSPRGLTWVWGLDDELVFACGRYGTIVRKVEEHWVHFDEGIDGHLYEIHGTAPDDLYVVGEEGRIFHYDGRTWTQIDPPTNFVLNSVLCCSRDLVYICGGGGMLFEGSGSRWRRIQTPAVDLYSLAIFREQLHLAAGGEGVLIVDGDVVTTLNSEIESYNLVANPQLLFSAGGASADWFDGKEWDGIEFD